MCGIAGFLGPAAHGGGDALHQMTRALAHRGPDDEGFWIDAQAGIALGQRRLAIVDLSPSGHQPMVSASGRWVIDYNGEVYNHRALRDELEAAGAAPAWRGRSDTEVLLAAIEHWGFAETLPRLNAMFALALWDRRDRVLYLARDRIGEKPLYYGRNGVNFFFGSELKALTAHPAFAGEVDREAIGAFLQFGYIPAPHSIWRGIAKLPPASWLVVSPDGVASGPTLYWDLAQIAQDGAAAARPGGQARVDALETLLIDAVKLRMAADVPLGSLLSGGVDSSLITALMQANASQPVRTFSIGFDDSAYDEAPHARAVARHLGTDHTEVYLSANDTQATLPRLADIWDEPFADSSQIPTYLVSQVARREVTVALTGDGGDELFAGYNRHVTAARIWNGAARLPAPMRRTAGAALNAPMVLTIVEGLSRALPDRWRVSAMKERLPKLGAVVDASSPQDFYARLVSCWPDPATVAIGATSGGQADHGHPAFADFRNTMMYLDAVTYLPDDILTKVDRAAMAVGLEGRVPFLDPRVVEFAWSTALDDKIRGGRGKQILREILYRYVPKALIDRPKKGFALPVGAWLRGPLRDWAEGLLDPARLHQEGWLHAAPIRAAWDDLQHGRTERTSQVWAALMFQAWLERHGTGAFRRDPARAA